ncbi:MAG: DUF58 domain-containing protein, partial [Chitinophagaceae bacterium]|nr:DUF58 domain-containing protein [Chitinophagaceae bacterium]
MTFFKKYIGSIFISNRLYAALALCIFLFVMRYFLNWLGIIPFIAFLAFVMIMLFDYLLLFAANQHVFARRTMAERLSNGDENNIRIDFENR